MSRSKWTYFQRKHPDSQQVHEKMLNITKQRMINANQNHNEVSLYTCQNHWYQKTTNNTVMMWRKKNPYALLVGM